MQTTDREQSIVEGMAGYNSCEDVIGALIASPLYNEYWETKRIYTEKIKIPMYLTGSYS
jgi:hypothetical protein